MRYEKLETDNGESLSTDTSNSKVTLYAEDSDSYTRCWSSHCSAQVELFDSSVRICLHLPQHCSTPVLMDGRFLVETWNKASNAVVTTQYILSRALRHKLWDGVAIRGAQMRGPRYAIHDSECAIRRQWHMCVDWPTRGQRISVHFNKLATVQTFAAQHCDQRFWLLLEEGFRKTEGRKGPRYFCNHINWQWGHFTDPVSSLLFILERAQH